jgi:hypothetical protein
MCAPVRPTNNPRLKQRWTSRYMPTLRVVTVKSSGGDYTSLSSAEALEQGDLPTLDRQLDIECYSMGDTAAVTIAGWTTDATRYLRIYTPTAERHDGKWNTSKYRLTPSASFGRALTIQEEYVRVEGLQMQNTNNTDGTGGVFVSVGNPSDVRITESIIRNSGRASTSQGNINAQTGTFTLRNCIIYGAVGASGVTLGNFGTASFTIENCTITNNATYGINRLSNTVNVTNTYCGGNGTDAYNGTMTRTTCAHSSATVFAGSTASVAHSTANFVNVTAGSQDYHLVLGSALIGAGTDLSATFTTDIDGQTRSGTWDIGADEYVATPSGFSAWWASAQTQIIGGGVYSL